MMMMMMPTTNFPPTTHFRFLFFLNNLFNGEKKNFWLLPPPLNSASFSETHTPPCEGCAFKRALHFFLSMCVRVCVCASRKKNQFVSIFSFSPPDYYHYITISFFFSTLSLLYPPNLL